jgi:hypothetical protein
VSRRRNQPQKTRRSPRHARAASVRRRRKRNPLSRRSAKQLPFHQVSDDVLNGQMTLLDMCGGGRWDADGYIGDV